MTTTPPTDDPFPEDDEQPAQLAIHADPRDSGTLEVFPPARTPMGGARAMLADHRAMLDDAHYTANVVCQTQMAPQRYRGKPKEATVAIMYGAEVGLPPLAAMQKVINIHGMPSLEARTMKGLLKTKGFQFRTVVKSETECEIHAWEPSSDKRNDPPDEVARWTIERAIKARYVPTPSGPDSQQRPDVDTDWVTVSKTWDGKTKTSVVGNMKYITDPITMLEAKATAEVCRAIAPEILMGLPYASEEADDIFDRWADDEQPADVVPRRGRTKGVSSLRERAKAAGVKAEKRAEAAADNEPQDAEVVPDVPAEGSPGAPAPGTEDVGGAVVDPGATGEEGQPDPTAMVAAPPTPAASAAAVDPTAFAQLVRDAEEAMAAEQAATPEPRPAPPAAAPDSGAAAPAAPASAGPAAAPEPAAPATEQPAVTITQVEGTTGEDLPGPAATPAAGPAPAAPAAPKPEADGLEMSDEVRARGDRMLADLLIEGQVDLDEAGVVVAEVAAKRPGGTYRRLADPRALTNSELKYVVDALRAHKQKGDLYDYCCEAANAASLREAGMMEG